MSSRLFVIALILTSLNSYAGGICEKVLIPTAKLNKIWHSWVATDQKASQLKNHLQDNHETAEFFSQIVPELPDRWVGAVTANQRYVALQKQLGIADSEIINLGSVFVSNRKPRKLLALKVNEAPPNGYTQLKGVLEAEDFFEALTQGILPMAWNGEVFSPSMGSSMFMLYHDMYHAKALLNKDYRKALLALSNLTVRMRGNGDDSYIFIKDYLDPFAETYWQLSSTAAMKVRNALSEFRDSTGQNVIDAQHSGPEKAGDFIPDRLLPKDKLKNLMVRISNFQTEMKEKLTQYKFNYSHPEIVKMHDKQRTLEQEFKDLTGAFRQFLAQLKSIIEKEGTFLGASQADGVSLIDDIHRDTYRRRNFENLNQRLMDGLYQINPQDIDEAFWKLIVEIRDASARTPQSELNALREKLLSDWRYRHYFDSNP